jgi:predicted NAD/FAD-binding protein
MKIAIIGTGISGLSVAHQLYPHHELTLFEANHYAGGHSNTVDVNENGKLIPIDTGFIVLNDWTYPNFIKILQSLNVDTYDSEMSFSARCEERQFEWCGNGIGGLVFNRDNWKKLSAYKMLVDIVNFNRLANRAVQPNSSLSSQQTLGDFLSTNKFSQAFIDYYILPMGAAIWSSSLVDINQYPALSFLNFFKNHGLLSVNNQPQWRTIAGGSREYVKKLTQPFQDRIHLNCAVERVIRHSDTVTLHTSQGDSFDFDHVFIACHSDQTLAMLDQASPLEQSTLGAIQYQHNVATLHTDSSIMPKRRKSWCAWNYLLSQGDDQQAKVTYYMNLLQRLDTHEDYFVSLNMEEKISPKKIVRSIPYMHPLFNHEAIQAQANFAAINGVNNTWYCGAYWRNGFHEDGVWSGLEAVKLFKQANG